MPTQTIPLTESKILHAYADKTPGSQVLHEWAKALLPNGVTHVGRYLEPHPVYIELPTAGAPGLDEIVHRLHGKLPHWTQIAASACRCS